MTLDLGTAGGARLEGGGEPWTLVFIRELRQPPAVVWAALTDPAQLDQWAPFSAARDLGATGATTLTMVDGDEKLDLPAEVRVVEPRPCWSTRGGRICCGGSWKRPAAAPG